MLRQSDPETAAVLLTEAKEDVAKRWKLCERLAKGDAQVVG
jgi:hypothetical protein